MSKPALLLAAAALVLVASIGLAASEKHVQAPLQTMNGSGVSGVVHITQMPKGGAQVVMNIQGLHAGSSYATFYYESADCSAPADEFEAFTADKDGRATLNGKIDDDVDEVGSFSVRVGPGYGDLLACATMHP